MCVYVFGWGWGGARGGWGAGGAGSRRGRHTGLGTWGIACRKENDSGREPCVGIWGVKLRPSWKNSPKGMRSAHSTMPHLLHRDRRHVRRAPVCNMRTGAEVQTRCGQQSGMEIQASPGVPEPRPCSWQGGPAGGHAGQAGWAGRPFATRSMRSSSMLPGGGHGMRSSRGSPGWLSWGGWWWWWCMCVPGAGRRASRPPPRRARPCACGGGGGGGGGRAGTSRGPTHSPWACPGP